MSAPCTFHCYTTDRKQVRTTAVTQVSFTLPQLEYRNTADTEVWQGQETVFLSSKLGHTRHSAIRLRIINRTPLWVLGSDRDYYSGATSATYGRQYIHCTTP
jgi:hypothetical protein